MKKEYLDKLKKEEVKILDYCVEICKKNNLNYVLIGGTLLGAVRHKGYIPWDDDLDIAMPRKDYEKFLQVFEETDKYILDCNDKKKYWLSFAKVRNKKTEYIEDLQANYEGEKGIWIDIFPLDNGKKEKSFIQHMQFLMTRFLSHAICYKVKINVKNSHLYSNIAAHIIALLPYKFLIKLQKNIMALNKNDNSEYFINLGSQYGYKKQVHLKNKYFPTKKMIFEGKEYDVPNDYDYVLTKIYGKSYMELPPIEKRVTHNPIKIKFEDGKELTFDDNNL